MIWLIIYLVGVIFFSGFIAACWAEDGVSHVSTCLLCVLLWPIIVPMFIGWRLRERSDD